MKKLFIWIQKVCIVLSYLAVMILMYKRHDEIEKTLRIFGVEKSMERCTANVIITNCSSTEEVMVLNIDGKAYEKIEPLEHKTLEFQWFTGQPIPVVVAPVPQRNLFYYARRTE